jgi:salicylate hydroxylase
VLSELLADPHITTSKHVVAALKAYDVVRRPRSQRVVTSSKENAKLLCLCFDGVVDDGDKLRETWSERYKWLWGIDVKEQVEEARRVMVGLLDGVLEMGE